MKFSALSAFLNAPVIEPVGGGAGGAAIPSITVNARADVSLVEHSFVATKSGSDYEGQLIRFILHFMWRALRHERARHIIAHLRLMVRVRSHTKLYVII